MHLHPKRIQRWLFKRLDRKFSTSLARHRIIDRETLLAHPPLGVRVIFFKQRETLHYAPPYHQQALPDAYPAQEQIIQQAPLFILEVTNANIRGRHAAVTMPDGAFILESMMNNPNMLDDVSIGRIHYPASASHFIRQIIHAPHYEQICPIVNMWSLGYYHWLTECLPRIYLFDEYKQLSGHHAPILIDPNPPRWMQDSLRLMGYETSDYLEWDATYAAVDCAYIPIFAYRPGVPSPYLLRKVGQRLRENLPQDTRQFDAPRIYISRKDATRRRVVNEDKVMAALAPYHFQQFVLSELSFAQQIQLFSQAKMVIGPHGAGLANLLFSDKALLIELFEPNYINTCFYRMSQSLDFPYSFLVGEAQGADMIVDVALLDELVQHFLLNTS